MLRPIAAIGISVLMIANSADSARGDAAKGATVFNRRCAALPFSRSREKGRDRPKPCRGHRPSSRCGALRLFPGDETIGNHLDEGDFGRVHREALIRD